MIASSSCIPSDDYIVHSEMCLSLIITTGKCISPKSGFWWFAESPSKSPPYLLDHLSSFSRCACRDRRWGQAGTIALITELGFQHIHRHMRIFHCEEKIPDKVYLASHIILIFQHSVSAKNKPIENILKISSINTKLLIKLFDISAL